MSQTPHFRLAVIGSGEAGGTLHLPAALASELIEVVALVDPAVERAEALALKYGLRPQIGRCIDEIQKPVDGAVIATPNNTHREVALACAAKYIHCLIEKPLATNIGHAEEICDAAEKHHIVLAVGYSMRFRNEVVLLKQLLESGYFGAIRRFHFQHGSRGGWSPVSGYNLDRKATGGGVLVVSGTHFLDLMLYWFGYPDGCEMLDDATGGPEAQCVVTVRYGGGGRQFAGTLRLSKVFELNPGIVIDAEKGQVVWGFDTSPLVFRPRERPQLQLGLQPRGEVCFPRGVYNFQLQLEDFVAACRGKRPPLVDGQQGLRSVRLLDQLYSNRFYSRAPGLSTPQAGPSCNWSANRNSTEGMKVAVFGASGFVGSTLVERLQQKGIEVAVAIHSAGNAWRLARHGIPLRSIDVLSRAAVAEGLRGCTHVVNCTRGSEEVMIDGLKNLLTEAARQRMRRFVHLSSVAVYGEAPPPESAFEECEARPEPGTYGAIKLHQEQLVARAHADGLSTIILCPPNITGIYSPFLCDVLQDMRCGCLALVDDGGTPINVVDVENLCHAIELALTVDSGDSRRIFVTDGDGITWRDFIAELMPVAELSAPLASLPRSSIVLPSATYKRNSLLRAMNHLVSADVRGALRTDPLFANMELAARGLIRKLPDRFEAKLRLRIDGPVQVAKVPTTRSFESRYVGHQLRNVTHSSERATRVLGYTRVIEFRQSMARFRRWYMATRGMDGESWPLARELLRYG